MPDSDSEHKRLKQHLDAKQWDQALAVTFELLKTQPQSSWLHATMGSIYRKINELTYAETSFKSSIYYQNSNVDAHTQLGFIYLDMGRTGTADDHCRIALGIDQSYTEAWLLGFKIKLAYSDLPAAREIYATLKRHQVDPNILRNLDFDLKRHTQNKHPIDYKAEISKREELLNLEATDHTVHSELAYFYNKYTNDVDKAKHHIEESLKHYPVKTSTHMTNAIIQRKRPFWLRILTSPVLSLTRPKELPKNEVATAGFVCFALLCLTAFGSKIDSDSPWITQIAIFSIIGMFFVSYTSYQAFLYLKVTESYHQLEKTSLFKGSFQSLHKLPLAKRTWIISILTVSSWLSLGAIFYLLVRQ